ncbi:calcium-binding EF-hand protein [Trifolium pratense]|uniref:Calcium-binding EF-hand protein n=1 Tax=Trifolium pratense TaxID=57577 RepID=A0A2K3P2K2_TRIPR|nr:calcium-binding EF-hand protein [Trifolium pratense]
MITDLLTSQVLNEFTHGKQEKVSKTEFKEVLSDILLGMAAGLKRDPIVILRIDGEDLFEFLNGSTYEPEIVSIFSQIESPQKSFHDYIIQALSKLNVDQGIPPTSDSWVVSNIVEPALVSEHGYDLDKPVSQEIFLEEFKKVALSVANRLKEQPVIVAHSESTFDGSGVKRLLSNKFELDKILNSAIETLPKDRNGKMSKDYLRVALDVVAPSAALPPFGAIEEVCCLFSHQFLFFVFNPPVLHQGKGPDNPEFSREMDKVIGEVFKMVSADDAKLVKEDEFKKILTEILGSIMLQLEGNPISVSSNSVVHEPLGSSSTLLQPSPAETA